jgi:hypothetical protein
MSEVTTRPVEQEPLGLDGWAERISSVRLPVLGSVVSTINQLAGDDDASVHELADVILKDASLTSQLLRVSNSSLYKPANARIDTVTRSIIQLGFDGVKSILISLLLVDRLLGGRPRRRLLEGMARSFHAAVQARELLADHPESEREQAFVAALLLNLGEVVIWSHGEQHADRLEGALEAGTDPEDATRAVLGTTFRDLTLALARSWGLGDVLEATLTGRPGKYAALVQAVELGDEMSRAAVHGWDSPQAQRILQQVSRLYRVPQRDARERALEAADLAAEVAVSFGAGQVCPHMPDGHQVRPPVPRTPPAAAQPARPEPERPAIESREMIPDDDVQQRILTELASMDLDTTDVNEVFAMALEGVHRGIGIERVALILIQGEVLATKYALGARARDWRERLRVPADEKNLFTVAIAREAPVWVRAEALSGLDRLYPPRFRDLVGQVPSFCAAIHVGNRVVGCYYADRASCDAVLTQAQFDAFSHLCHQTRLALTRLAKRQREQSAARAAPAPVRA